MSRFNFLFFSRKLSESDQQNRELIGVISKKEEALYQSQVSNYFLFPQSEVFTGKSQTDTLPYCPSGSDTMFFLITFCFVLQARNRPVDSTGEYRMIT